MKRKFLAKAITLGLMLAVPLGAQAKTVNTATDDNKIFPNGLELSITSANTGDYSGEDLHLYDVSKAGEEVKGDVTFNMSDFDNGTNRIITIQTTADNATSTINGNVNVTGNKIKANIVAGILANTNNSAATVNGDLQINIQDSANRTYGVYTAKTSQATIDGDVTVTATNTTTDFTIAACTMEDSQVNIGGDLTVNAANTTGRIYAIYLSDKSQANIGGDVSVTATDASGSVFGVYTTKTSQATIDGNVSLTATDASGSVFGVYTNSESQANIGGDVSLTATDASGSVFGVYTNSESQATVGGELNIIVDNSTSSIYGLAGNGDITAKDNINITIENVPSTISSQTYFRAIQTNGNTIIGSADKPVDVTMRVIGKADSNFKDVRIQNFDTSGNLTHYGNANLYLQDLGAMTPNYDNISGYWVDEGTATLVGDVNVTYVATDNRVDTTLNQNIYGVSVAGYNTTTKEWQEGTFNHTGNVNVYLAGKAEKMGLENNTVYGSVTGGKGTYNHTNGLRTLYFGTDDTPFISSDANPFKGSFANFDVIKVNKGSTLVLDPTQKSGLKGDQDFLGGNDVITDENGNKDYKDLPAESNQVNSITSTGGTLSLGNDNTIIVEEGASAKIDTVTSNAGNIVANGADNVTIGKLEGEQVTITTDTIKKDLINVGSNTNSNIKLVADSKAAESINSSDIKKSLQDVADTIKITDNNENTKINLKVEQSTILGEIEASVDANGDVVDNSIRQAVNTDNEAISNMASISLMTWRQENNDMNKRLGELRDSKGEHGAWARMARGESKYGAQNIKNQYNYYQVGYDEKLSVNPNWTVGVALTRTEGSSTFNNGSAENKHTGVAVYGSYLKDDGSFIDLIAKYARMKNEFTVSGGAGNGDYETNGYSLSAEYGKRFTKDNGFWIEPQAELTYGYVGAASYLSSNGANVRQDGMDSLVGRIGFSLGRDIKAGNVYARASYLYDFDGETDVSFSKGTQRSSFKQDLGGGWWEVGVGTNLNLSEATHLYFDVEKTYGGNVATPWQWNAGVRWSF